MAEGEGLNVFDRGGSNRRRYSVKCVLLPLRKLSKKPHPD